MDDNKINWLRLIRSEKVGPVTFWELIDRYGTAEKALDALSQGIRQGNHKYRLASEEEAIKELEAHRKKGIRLLAAFETDFPQLLRPLPDCPPVLSVYGKADILNRPTLGIVGARNASLNGRNFAEKLAKELSQAGWTIASGLARGIDAYAHQGSLTSGTIAVIAGGVDVIYPPEHEKLYHEIAKIGAVISEMPLTLFPGATHFPRRNRLISGLSRGVIVIEAAFKSGSLITARYTLEQGRELFAVPGSPLDPRCKGTNNLLRQGAHLIESAADVLAVLGCVGRLGWALHSQLKRRRRHGTIRPHPINRLGKPGTGRVRGFKPNTYRPGRDHPTPCSSSPNHFNPDAGMGIPGSHPTTRREHGFPCSLIHYLEMKTHDKTPHPFPNR